LKSRRFGAVGQIGMPALEDQREAGSTLFRRFVRPGNSVRRN